MDHAVQDVLGSFPIHQVIQEVVEVLLECSEIASVEVELSHGVFRRMPVSRLQWPANAHDDSAPELRAEFAINYHDLKIGTLTLATERDFVGRQALGRQAAKLLAYRLKRQELRALARFYLDVHLPLVGRSDHLNELDRYIEEASRSRRPASISAEPGSLAFDVATALHLAGPNRAGRCVRVDCAVSPDSYEWCDLLIPTEDAARAATLILVNYHTLQETGREALAELVRRAKTTPFEPDLRVRTRVILVREARIASDEVTQRHEAIAEELGALPFAVRPLRERPEDIQSLVVHFCQRYGLAHAPRFSDGALQAFEAYQWPGNSRQLSRLVAHVVAVVPPHDLVDLPLLRRIAPELLAPGPRSAMAARRDVDLGALCRRLLRDPSNVPSAWHPSLRRVVHRLLASYRQRMSLKAVASEAHVSSSHLAALFRRSLGSSFTQFVTRLRIESAKRLLLDQPAQPITSIAGDVGFGDLRHFERTFKRVVGCTPRDYRTTQEVQVQRA